MADLDVTLAALADPARRAIVESLLREPARPSALADLLSLSRPAVSRHLRVLRDAGLIEQALDGDDARMRPIRLLAAPFRELRGWLDEVEAYWGDQLASFRDYAEAKHRKDRRR